MKELFFQLASDFMAAGPTGSDYWTALNPAFANRLGIPGADGELLKVPHPRDPSRLVSRDGSYVDVDWTVREEDGVTYWVGREKNLHQARELHHRLKNNLQFVISLLSFQATRLKDVGARGQFTKAESRIRAVAHLHEAAYASLDLSQVEFAAYLRRLVHDLAFGEVLEAHVDAIDVVLSMEQAVPLAIIAHELVSNALQHAGASAIRVSLRYEQVNRVCLSVADDGDGTKTSVHGTGLELVDLFADQLRARVHHRIDNGLHVSVNFELGEE